MQLPEISDTAVSNVVRLAEGARKTRVLYAGDMEFAKAQFASVAPQLQLFPAAAVLTSGASAPPASGETPDVALIDCGAPGVDPRALVDAIRARGLDLPIVLALDPGGSDNAPNRVSAELRVDDYTVKLPGWLARLTSRLEFAIAHHRRRRSLETLQIAAERLRTVVESAPVCLARVARDGTILAMNAAAMKMVSADAAEEVLGKSLLSFVESNGADGVRRFLDTVSGGQPGSLEFETGGAAGAARVVDTRAVPLSPDAEGRSSALLVLRDATERKRLEESMLAAAPVSHPVETGDAHAEERESLRQQLETALAECRTTQAERDVLRADAEEARARATMVEHVRAACTAAEQQLAEMQAAYERVVIERDALAQDLGTAGARNEAALAEHRAEYERQQELARSTEAERAHLASRCDALEALVASFEARQATEREDHRLAREQSDAEIRRLQQPDPLAAEREALLVSLGALRAQFDEMSASVDAAEARHAADMRDQHAATAALEARLREAEQTHASLASERDQLRTALEESRTGGDAQLTERDAVHRSLEQRIEDLQARVDGAIAERDAIRHELHAAAETANGRSEQLQAALDEVRAARDAQGAESEAIRRELLERIDDLQSRLQAAVGERDALLHEMQLALDAADARSQQLQVALDDVRAGRETQAAGAETVRRELFERVDELQARMQAALAERDAVRHEMRMAVDDADARVRQLQAALDDLVAGRETQAAEADAVRRTLTHRVEELQTRLDGVIIDREALERALEDARVEHTRHLHDAAAERESLQQRLQDRDAEYTFLCAQHAALQAREREAADAVAAASAAPRAEPPAEPAPRTAADLQDAQAAFREAFQLLSGELQNAAKTTRAHQAALLRQQPAGYDLLEERLRQAEADCRRLIVERDERDTTVRALQAEIEQLIAVRREQRKELVRALQESDETERRAAARLAECARLRHTLAEAQSALQRLSTWAANQSARIGPSGDGIRRPVSRIEAPAKRSTGPDDGASAPPLEASWS